MPNESGTPEALGGESSSERVGQVEVDPGDNIEEIIVAGVADDGCRADLGRVEAHSGTYELRYSRDHHVTGGGGGDSDTPESVDDHSWVDLHTEIGNQRGVILEVSPDIEDWDVPSNSRMARLGHDEAAELVEALSEAFGFRVETDTGKPAQAMEINKNSSPDEEAAQEALAELRDDSTRGDSS